MAAGRRRKVGAVRQIGGRVAPEHRNGALVQVVASRLPCPACGSGKIRVTTSGQECQACWETREKRRTELRRSYAGRNLSWLIGERSRKGRVMLAQYKAWQALGDDPLSRGRTVLERLQAHLDAVQVLDAELKRRYAAGTGAQQPLDITDRKAAAVRRRLFADLASGPTYRRGSAGAGQPAGRAAGRAWFDPCVRRGRRPVRSLPCRRRLPQHPRTGRSVLAGRGLPTVGPPRRRSNPIPAVPGAARPCRRKHQLEQCH
jgi:hypothetical protein